MDDKFKKRVVFFINVDWYFFLHWKERVIALKGAGYCVRVLTRFSSEKYKNMLGNLGVEFVEIDYVRHKTSFLKELRCFVQMYRVLWGERKRPVVVHAVTFKPIFYTLVLGVINKFDAFLSFPGLGELSVRSGTLTTIIWKSLFILTRLQRANSKIVFTFENSNDLSLFKARCGDRYPCRVIPGAGVDLNLYRPSNRSDENVVKVLFASRLLKSKGLSLLVEAIELLVESKLCVELHVAGISDGSHFDAISENELNRLLSKHFVVWHGECQDMAKLLAKVDIVCLPTTYGEGIPRILLEGAASGLPLVGSDIPGCREVIKNNLTGYLIDPLNKHDVASALQKLVLNPDTRKSLGINARSLVEDQMSNDIVLKKTLNLYGATLK